MSDLDRQISTFISHFNLADGRTAGRVLLYLAVLLVGSGLLASASQAQVPQNVITECEACRAQDVYAADLNGDGNPDVLSASEDDDKIAWYENNGDGTFSDQQIITNEAGNAQSVYAADLTGNGQLDVLSASEGNLDEGPKIAWYENNGDGTFSEQQVITTDAEDAQSVYAADLTGDGQTDVLSASDDKIAWYENNGNGTFSDQQVISSAAEAQSVYAADLTGDGQIDVLSASQGSGGLIGEDPKIAWYENNGDGTFLGQNVITTDVDDPQSVHAVDLTGNGDPDVLSASSDDDKIAWHENNGDGTFSGQNVITTDVDDPQSVHAVDLTGNGDPDVLSASSGDDKIAWHENNGDGSFSEQNLITTEASFAQSVYAADLTEDGQSDILSASSIDDKVAWHENTGDGSFSAQKVITECMACRAQDVHAADLTGDGNPDILSASKVDDKIAWYGNNGDGTVSDQQIITTDAEGAQSVYAADLNGSGSPDVLSASKDDDKIAWYENSGNGTFSDPNVITTDAVGATSVYAADLTGNGQPDILSASEGDISDPLEPPKIAWYENNGDGTFSGQNVITTGVSLAESVYAADLTGDGQLDVLSGDRVENEVVWYENNGDGTFSDRNVITTNADQPSSVYATDLTGDGHSDVLFVSSIDDDKIAWHENNGDGTFSDQKVITTDVDNAESVYAADLTGTGNPDVLSASGSSFGGSKIAWYENNGDGTFSDQNVITTGVSLARSVYAADLTGDGQPDVLSASEDYDKIAWYENTDDTLPVELAGFDATVDGDAVQLSWSTASETRNAEFQIQRRVASTPGVRRMGERANVRKGAWTTVGSVDGSGTTSQPQSYRFTDDDLPYAADALTYRLRQVDTDGSASLSKEITVERGVNELELLGTYPNPARQRATVRYALPEKQDVSVRLYDVLGRQVRTILNEEQEGRHQRTLDVGVLPSGVYFLRLRAGGETRTQKLTIAR